MVRNMPKGEERSAKAAKVRPSIHRDFDNTNGFLTIIKGTKRYHFCEICGKRMQKDKYRS